MKENIEFYLCTTNWDWELGETDCDTYESLEHLQRKRKCWEQCGVTKVTLNKDGTWKKEEIIPSVPYGERK
jgi:hypothetical protein